MENFNDYIYKYWLHDTLINDIRVEDKKLVFCFQEGIYVFDEIKQETVSTAPCEMEVYLDIEEDDELWTYIYIEKGYKKKSIEISFEKLQKEIQKSCCRISCHYYSYFLGDNTILLECYIDGRRVIIKISSINNIVFKFL